MICKLVSGCENEVFGELDFCALHCSDEEIKYKSKYNYSKEFSNLFMKYLFEKIINHKFYKVDKYGNFISDYKIYDFSYRKIIDNDILIKRIGALDIVVDNIKFIKEYDTEAIDLNCKNIIKKLGRVEFKNCYFNDFSFIGAYNSYYEKCIFSEDINIHPFPEIINEKNISYRYNFCDFEGDVSVSSSIFSNEMHCNVFKNCNFGKNISINDLTIHKNLFLFPNLLEDSSVNSIKNNFEQTKNSYKIDSLNIKNCIFKSDFKINGFDQRSIDNLRLHGCEFEKSILNINSLKIVDTKFESKVEIKYRSIDNFKFINSNVDKTFDLFKSRFKKVEFNKSVFNGFTGFEEVTFGLSVHDDDLNEEERLLFKKRESTRFSYLAFFEHVTFMDFSSFRGAKFNSGLNFSKNNLKDKPNFLGVEVDSLNTNRETFRIVKSSFDDAGNQIEANKFFVEEMKAYRRELKEKGWSWFNRFILFLNRWISNFGSNYVLPIGWLLVSIFVYTEIIDWHE